MGTEIERKFLVEGEAWRDAVRDTVAIEQGYMRALDATIRVRIAGERGIFTVKGATLGVTRGEWEWEIPSRDARELLDTFCAGRRIAKVRHTVWFAEHAWVVDVFEGENDGLVMAEIELDAEDEAFDVPPWAGAEVSGDTRYYNSNLATAPYVTWGT